MRGSRVKQLRTAEHPHPGRKHGGGPRGEREHFRPDITKAWPVGVLRFANERNAKRARKNGVT